MCGAAFLAKSGVVPLTSTSVVLPTLANGVFGVFSVGVTATGVVFFWAKSPAGMEMVVEPGAVVVDGVVTVVATCWVTTGGVFFF